jgi:peptidoglycan/xylan/chitin deacetylase (PgdA/CDA1 family)
VRKAQLCSRLLAVTGGGALARRARAWGGVLGLAYHRIGDPAGSPFDHGLWSATPDAFDQQVRFLTRHFDVIGPDDLETALRRRRGRYVLITFDDGYRDNYEHAFPILRSHAAGGLFFVTTGFLDRPGLSWWDEIAWMVRTSPRPGLPAGPWLPAPVPFDPPDRGRAICTLLSRFKQLPTADTPAYLDFLADATGRGRYAGPDADQMWMTWDMVREMAAGGMWVGGHTVTHPVLGRADRARQEEEILRCGRRLEQELGRPMRSFSYPIGSPTAFNADTRDCLRAAGVRFAFSYYGGYRRFDDWDDYDVRRLAVELDTTPDLFRAMVTLPQVFGRPAVIPRPDPPAGPPG